MTSARIDRMIRLYTVEQKTVWEIAEIVGLSGTVVWKILKREGVKFRPANAKGRPWGLKKRGKEYLGADGRWWVRGVRSTKSKNAKRRARVVVEKSLGRKLSRKTHVHHQSEDIRDDRLSNLRPLRAKAHNRHHHLGRSNSKKASMLGKKHSKETRNKMKQSALKRWRERC